MYVFLVVQVDKDEDVLNSKSYDYKNAKNLSANDKASIPQNVKKGDHFFLENIIIPANLSEYIFLYIATLNSNHS